MKALPALNKWIRRAQLSSALVFFTLFLVGCRTAAPAAAPDSSMRDVRLGQAIWRPDRSRPEIAGDLLVSTNETGTALLSFSKTLPLVSARIGPEGWRVEFPPQNRKYSGRGRPPRQIVWLQLLRALTGEEVSSNWQINAATNSAVTLSNAKTGEHLEVHF